MDNTLTFRQERFVFEYLKDQNASAAAARAGYTARNLASQGNELMKNPAVRDRVRLELAGLLSEVRCSALELMRQRARIAFFRVDKLFAQGWDPLPLDQLDEETRAVLEVSTVLRKNGPVTRVKHPDRSKALRALERVHETMDRLNEQYWAKLEKAGMLPSLEEIDAVDAGLVGEGQTPAADIPEKHQVLSGSATDASCSMAPFDKLRTNGVVGGGANFSEKPQVLSGSLAQAGNAEPNVFAENPQVLSGSGPATPNQIREEPQVLSGSKICISRAARRRAAQSAQAAQAAQPATAPPHTDDTALQSRLAA